MIKVNFLVDDELSVVHQLKALDAVKSNNGDFLFFSIIAKSKPTIVVLLEVVGVKNEYHFAATILVVAIVHLDHVVGCCSVDEGA